MTVVKAYALFVRKRCIQDHERLNGVARLVAFMRDWDCRVPLASLFDYLKLRALDGKTCPLRVFALASRIHEPDLAEWVLRNCYAICWTKEDRGGVFGQSKLSPRTWPRGAPSMIDSAYLWALERAHTNPDSADDLAVAFLRHLQYALSCPEDGWAGA
jgi:hypothetical protein